MTCSFIVAPLATAPLTQMVWPVAVWATPAAAFAASGNERMHHAEAVALLRPAIEDGEGGEGGCTWADLGAGRGTFTMALAELLGASAVVHAIDRDPDAVAALQGVRSPGARIIARVGDFASAGDGTVSALAPLDGILLANALHYTAHPGEVLQRLGRLLAPGSAVVLVEYDRRTANPWVPYPVPAASLASLAATAELDPFEVVARLPSRYGGDLYVAVTRRNTSP